MLKCDMDVAEVHGVRTRSMSLQQNQALKDLIAKSTAAMNESFIMPAEVEETVSERVTQIMGVLNRRDGAPITTAAAARAV